MAMIGAQIDCFYECWRIIYTDELLFPAEKLEMKILVFLLSGIKFMLMITEFHDEK